MVQKNIWLMFNPHYGKYIFFFITTIFFSCNNSTDKKEVTIQKSEFNNDSAQKALLSEYLNERDHPIKTMIDTHWVKKIVDFSEIFPVFIDNCTPCHSENGNAPFVLNSFNAIRKKSAVIKDVMLERLMPPFMADAHYSSLINAPRMNDSLRWRIINWIDQGCFPAKYSYNKYVGDYYPTTNNTNFKTFEVQEHTINSNNDSYQCYVIDLNLLTDTFVKAIRYHSTNPSTIHHIMVYLDTAGVLNTQKPCWDCMQDGIVNKLVPIDSWSRGMVAYELSKEFAFKFPKGSKLLLQTHYGNEGNKGKKEKTSLDLFMRTKPPREIKFEIINNLTIFFPANKTKTETIRFKTDSAISLIGCVPHMHFLAQKVEVFAITPTGKKINILKINNWDYLWQSSYLFKSLIEIPVKSTIYMNVVFDNTSKNDQQPNNPIRNVKYNTFSNEEMMVLCLYTTPFKKGDKTKLPLQILR